MRSGEEILAEWFEQAQQAAKRKKRKTTATDREANGGENNGEAAGAKQTEVAAHRPEAREQTAADRPAEELDRSPEPGDEAYLGKVREIEEFKAQIKLQDRRIEKTLIERYELTSDQVRRAMTALSVGGSSLACTLRDQFRAEKRLVAKPTLTETRRKELEKQLEGVTDLIKVRERDGTLDSESMGALWTRRNRLQGELNGKSTSRALVPGAC